MASAAVESFVAKQLDLLELERDAEVEERRYGRRPGPRVRSGGSPRPPYSLSSDLGRTSLLGARPDQPGGRDLPS